MKVKPLFKTTYFNFFSVSNDTDLELPFVTDGINAGFPSPATDFLDATIDLNKHLIKNPSTTFIAVTSGTSMIGAGINDNDLLIIDKSLEPTNGAIAVCVIDNEFTLKRLKVERKQVYLMPENPEFKPIKITEYQDFEIWGILTYSIKHHKH
ncbi:MAG: translesion error-prone DNA polymerase V autoproteolytic subunit [Chitinophagaceae bacterium]|nr:translesion error-prone DNA polymerase V autoproteolytic subunit [Chitinophagaceae bacterium]